MAVDNNKVEAKQAYEWSLEQESGYKEITLFQLNLYRMAEKYAWEISKQWYLDNTDWTELHLTPYKSFTVLFSNVMLPHTAFGNPTVVYTVLVEEGVLS